MRPILTRVGFVMLFAWFGHGVLFTFPGLASAAGFAWWNRARPKFWVTFLVTAGAAIAAQVAWLGYRVQGKETLNVWDAMFRILFSHALFVTLGLAVILAIAGIANKKRRQRFPGLLAGLGLSLLVQLPLSFYGRWFYGLFDVRLVY